MIYLKWLIDGTFLDTGKLQTSIAPENQKRETRIWISLGIHIISFIILSVNPRIRQLRMLYIHKNHYQLPNLN